jgi:anti-anti-sigma regulatory factor
MMTLRIQRSSDAHGTIVRLSGRMGAEHREELAKQMASSTARIALDLEEVTLVDIDIVQFLATSEAGGVELLHCPAYIREWISRENDRAGRV